MKERLSKLHQAALVAMVLAVLGLSVAGCALPTPTVEATRTPEAAYTLDYPLASDILSGCVNGVLSVTRSFRGEYLSIEARQADENCYPPWVEEPLAQARSRQQKIQAHLRPPALAKLARTQLHVLTTQPELKAACDPRWISGVDIPGREPPETGIIACTRTVRDGSSHIMLYQNLSQSTIDHEYFHASVAFPEGDFTVGNTTVSVGHSENGYVRFLVPLTCSREEALARPDIVTCLAGINDPHSYPSSLFVNASFFSEVAAVMMENNSSSAYLRGNNSDYIIHDPASLGRIQSFFQDPLYAAQFINSINSGNWSETLMLTGWAYLNQLGTQIDLSNPSQIADLQTLGRNFLLSLIIHQPDQSAFWIKSD